MLLFAGWDSAWKNETRQGCLMYHASEQWASPRGTGRLQCREKVRICNTHLMFLHHRKQDINHPLFTFPKHKWFYWPVPHLPSAIFSAGLRVQTFLDMSGEEEFQWFWSPSLPLFVSLNIYILVLLNSFNTRGPEMYMVFKLWAHCGCTQ